MTHWRPGMPLTEASAEALALAAIRGDLATETAAQYLARAYAEARGLPNRNALYRWILRPLHMHSMGVGDIALAIRAAREEVRRDPSARSYDSLLWTLRYYGFLSAAVRAGQRGLGSITEPSEALRSEAERLSMVVSRANLPTARFCGILHEGGRRAQEVLAAVVPDASVRALVSVHDRGKQASDRAPYNLRWHGVGADVVRNRACRWDIEAIHPEGAPELVRDIAMRVARRIRGVVFDPDARLVLYGRHRVFAVTG